MSKSVIELNVTNEWKTTKNTIVLKLVMQMQSESKYFSKMFLKYFSKLIWCQVTSIYRSAGEAAFLRIKLTWKLVQVMIENSCLQERCFKFILHWVVIIQSDSCWKMCTLIQIVFVKNIFSKLSLNLVTTSYNTEWIS